MLGAKDRGATRISKSELPLMYKYTQYGVTAVNRRSLLAKAFGAPSEVHSVSHPSTRSHQTRALCETDLLSTTLPHWFGYGMIILRFFRFVKRKFAKKLYIFIYLCQYFLSRVRYIIASAM